MRVYYVYILESSNHTYYTGCTNALEERIEIHNMKKRVKYTRGQTPVASIYYEVFEGKVKALKREYAIK